MSISYNCGCGAKIRLPHTAAGRRAKCKSCGIVFTVPERGGIVVGTDASPDRATLTSKPAPAGAEPGLWLDDLAANETRAASEQHQSILDLAEPDPEPDQRPSRRRDDTPSTPAHMAAWNRDDGEWILAPQRSFWADLLDSFIFFVDAANLVSFISLAAVSVVAGFIPFFGGIISMIVSAYICAFLMATVLETASGEDELPSVWISSVWDDLILPCLQFAGTWLFVLLPAITLTVIYAVQTGWHPWDYTSRAATSIPWSAIYTLAAIGLFFWPAVVLAVTIGATFRGLWPHIVIRSAASAPLAYLAICAALFVAALLAGLPENPAVIRWLGLTSPLHFVLLGLVGQVLGLYSSIVAMRVIGLFYRHYKHRLPWVAE